MSIARRFVTVILMFALGVSIAGAQSGPPRPIALTDTDGVYGPQLGAGVVFEKFTADAHLFANPVMNNIGDVVFIATISGPGVTADNDTGLWVYRRGQLRLLAREGDPAPEAGPGVVFSRFGNSTWNGSPPIPLEQHICDDRLVAFKVTLRGGDVTFYANGGSPNDDALYAERNGALHLLIREGVTELPGFPGVIFGNSNTPPDDNEFWWGTPINMLADGRVLIRSRVKVNTGNNNWDVVVTDRDGPMATIYRGGEAVPGYPPAVFWTTSWPYFVGDGKVCHWAGNTEAATVGFGSAIWSDRGGSYAAVLKEGDALSGGDYYEPRSTPFAVNAAGRVAFVNSHDDYGYDAALWTEGIFGVPIRIALGGGTAPGTGGASFIPLDSSLPAIATNGMTYFKAYLYYGGNVNDTNDEGIWANRTNAVVSLVHRESDAAPGLPGQAFAQFQSIFVNDAGRLAFVAMVDDNQRGLWVHDANGGAQLIVKALDASNSFDVFGDGSDLRIVLDIIMDPYSPQPEDIGTIAATGAGRRIPFNDAADVTFRLSFLDGSEGIFATSPAQNPLGDMNCDGVLDLFDIEPFALALSSAFHIVPFDDYVAAYPDCDPTNADADLNGTVDLFDIDPFVVLLAGK